MSPSYLIFSSSSLPHEERSTMADAIARIEGSSSISSPRRASSSSPPYLYKKDIHAAPPSFSSSCREKHLPVNASSSTSSSSSFSGAPHTSKTPLSEREASRQEKGFFMSSHAEGTSNISHIHDRMKEEERKKEIGSLEKKNCCTSDFLKIKKIPSLYPSLFYSSVLRLQCLLRRLKHQIILDDGDGRWHLSTSSHRSLPGGIIAAGGGGGEQGMTSCSPPPSPLSPPLELRRTKSPKYQAAGGNMILQILAQAAGSGYEDRERQRREEEKEREKKRKKLMMAAKRKKKKGPKEDRGHDPHDSTKRERNEEEREKDEERSSTKEKMDHEKEKEEEEEEEEERRLSSSSSGSASSSLSGLLELNLLAEFLEELAGALDLREKCLQEKKSLTKQRLGEQEEEEEEESGEGGEEHQPSDSLSLFTICSDSKLFEKNEEL
ncbi:hypothetical protein CSUI_008714, partial [Cystoisospora suis]